MESNDVRSFEEEDFYHKTTPEEKIKFILRYGILAPSTHNSQPWLFKIDKDSCEVYYDYKVYTIREADPLKRDLFISLGCLLENVVVAARYFGVFEEMDLCYRGNGELVAKILFKNLEKRDWKLRNEALNPLVVAIRKRVNARGVFEQRNIPRNVEEKFSSSARAFPKLELKMVKESVKIEKLGRLTAEGLKIAYNSRSFRREMSKWLNSNFSKRKEGIPGYALRIPTFLSIIFPFLVRYFNIGKRVGFLNFKSISSAPLISIIGGKENSPREWLDVGQLAQRIILEAWSAGLRTSIFVAAIEVSDLYKEVKRVAGMNSVPQLLVAIGYMKFQHRLTPRHSIDEKIIT